METERMSPLRQRMIEDMRIRGMGEKAQKGHIRTIKDFAKFLGRSPDTATPEDLRAYQLHMIDAKIGIPTFNIDQGLYGSSFGRSSKKTAIPKAISPPR